MYTLLDRSDGSLSQDEVGTWLGIILVHTISRFVETIYQYIEDLAWVLMFY